MSSKKDERVAASKILSGPTDMPEVDRSQLIDDVRQALYAAKICSYAQGLNLIREAAAVEEDRPAEGRAHHCCVLSLPFWTAAR